MAIAALRQTHTETFIKEPQELAAQAGLWVSSVSKVRQVLIVQKMIERDLTGSRLSTLNIPFDFSSYVKTGETLIDLKNDDTPTAILTVFFNLPTINFNLPTINRSTAVEKNPKYPAFYNSITEQLRAASELGTSPGTINMLSYLKNRVEKLAKELNFNLLDISASTRAVELPQRTSSSNSKELAKSYETLCKSVEAGIKEAIELLANLGEQKELLSLGTFLVDTELCETTKLSNGKLVCEIATEAKKLFKKATTFFSKDLTALNNQLDELISQLRCWKDQGDRAPLHYNRYPAETVDCMEFEIDDRIEYLYTLKISIESLKTRANGRIVSGLSSQRSLGIFSKFNDALYLLERKPSFINHKFTNAFLCYVDS